LTDLGVEPVRQRLEPVAETELEHGPLDVGERQRRPREPQVRRDRPVEEERLLWHHHEAGAQLGVRHLGERHPADAHDTGRRIGQPGDQPSERGLARTGLPHHRHLLTGGEVGGDVDQHRGFVVVAARPVGEGDVVDVDVELPRRDVHRTRWFGRTDRDLEDAEHPPEAGHRGLGLVDHLGELGDRLEEPIREEDESHHRAGREP